MSDMDTQTKLIVLAVVAAIWAVGAVIWWWRDKPMYGETRADVAVRAVLWPVMIAMVVAIGAMVYWPVTLIAVLAIGSAAAWVLA